MRDNEAPELDLAEDIIAFENAELTEDQTIRSEEGISKTAPSLLS
jgi:hypothetical protein